MKKIDLISYEKFLEMNLGSELREHYGDNTLGWTQIWGNGIAPKTDTEMYELYKKWHNRNYTKLGQALK